ncbi:hypothetical protein [Pectobacterium polaris]|uniref:hypothetical protein n=1 Tax=Pectobacterium polaris TaxID=2042057 RepID=UPI002175A48F|nr:hypothetical protein [Pectobacterium polaris]
MSVRSEIIDGRQASGVTYGLIYTEVLGWIDLGHAKGDDIDATCSTSVRVSPLFYANNTTL